MTLEALPPDVLSWIRGVVVIWPYIILFRYYLSHSQQAHYKLPVVCQLRVAKLSLKLRKLRDM